jgi:hypothetical protein
VKTKDKRACSVCGTLLADDSSYCPVCALRGAVETQPDSLSDSSSELRFEHYTVLQNAEGKPFELGRGGMGVTYKAFDVHLQRPAALKIINAQLFGIPRQVFALWVEFLQGNHPTMERFGAAREQLYRKVEADPSDPFLVTALACADLALGRKEESIQEGRRAMELRPISEDAYEGPLIATDVAEIYALTNQRDVSLAQLKLLAKIPCWLLSYGNLKTNPGWDPLRNDPHFEQLLTELAPRD